MNDALIHKIKVEKDNPLTEDEIRAVLSLHNRYYAYDIETHPNVFTFAIEDTLNPNKKRVYEISEFANDIHALLKMLDHLKEKMVVMVGYNNLGFDYPVIHLMLTKVNRSASGKAIAYALYTKAMEIIHSNNSIEHIIWHNNQEIPQADLFKIHHFDNKARQTSLKMLEFNMRMDDIRDLPYKQGTVLIGEQVGVLKPYNQHDTTATAKFFRLSIPQIKFREDLGIKHGKHMLWDNDKKIGSNYFIARLQEAGIECYEKVNGERQPRQTHRSHIKMKDIIFPIVKFESPEFQQVHQWLNGQVITETKGVFDGLNVVYGGFRFDFGTGGLHGCISSGYVDSDDDCIILDADVGSYYPSIDIQYRLFPAHLSEKFCDIYEDVKNQRFSYAKGTPENAMLKLALNAAGFGDTNNEFSPFFDPKMTMAVTVNGQLMLCMLSEKLIDTIPGLQMIQANTDGVTVKIPREAIGMYREVCQQWEKTTGMVLEYVAYSRFWVRDVNNYIGEMLHVYDDNVEVVKTFKKGEKLKNKGAYAHKNLEWHKDHSSLVVQKAAEAFLVSGTPVTEFITNHSDKFDFMLRVKIPKSSRLIGLSDDTNSVIPSWYASLPLSDRYLIEGVHVSDVLSIYRKYVGDDTKIYNKNKNVLADVLSRHGKESTQELYQMMGDELGITWKQFKLIMRWYVDRDGESLPSTVIYTDNNLQSITRYYVAKEGYNFFKVMPPLSGKDKERYMAVNSGMKVAECNHVNDYRHENLDMQWYIDEALKLISPVNPALHTLPRHDDLWWFD